MHASIKRTRIISGEGASTKPRRRFSESQSGDPMILANPNVRERGFIGNPIATLWTDDFRSSYAMRDHPVVPTHDRFSLA